VNHRSSYPVSEQAALEEAAAWLLAAHDARLLEVKRTPSGPCMWWSPKSDAFQPPNEWNAIGTGIGTLTPTIPTSTSWAKARAASPSLVKTATLACPLKSGPP
jgi:hypothetical protein